MHILILVIAIFGVFAVLYRKQQTSKNKTEIKKASDENQAYWKAHQKELRERRAYLYDPSVSLEDKFKQIKKNYPFSKWRSNFFEYEMEQYTEKVCQEAEQIMDGLMASLLKLDIKASEAERLKLFEKTVLEYNKLNGTDSSIIETGEREDLCDIFDQIGVAVGIDPEKHDDDIVLKWRAW